MSTDTLAPGAEAKDAEVRAHTSGGRATLELILVGLGALAVSLSQSVLVPVLGELQAEYGENTNWLLTSTLLVAAVAVPIMGRLGDMFGKRLMLLVAVGALVVGSLVDALSDDLTWLIVGRALQGLSAAAIPLGISLLATLLPREKVGNAVAIISAMLGVGGALGLPFAGFIAQNSDWHTLFWVNGGVGLLSFLGILLLVPESKDRTGGRVDLIGAVLLTASLVALILPLQQGHDWGWDADRTLYLFGAAAVLLIVFALAELKIKNPLVDLRALRRPPIVMTNIASVLFAFALFASFIGTATFVEAGEWTGYGFDSTLVVGGLTLLPSGIAMLIFSPIAAKVIEKIGAPSTLAVGAFIVAIGWISRYFFSDSILEVVIGTAISGAGTGIGYAAMPTLINSNTPPSEIAAANGLNSLFRSLGSTLASAIGTSILASSYVVWMVGHKPVMHDGAPVAAPSLDAYNWLFLTCAGVSVLCALISLFIPRGRAAAAASADAAEAAAPAEGVAAPTAGGNGVSVHGSVRGPEGAAVSQATVTLISLAGRQLGRAVAHADGAYALDAPGAGTYVLIASADGFQPQASTVVVGIDPMTYDVLLSGTSGLKGLVHTGDGAPVEGAVVIVTDVRGDLLANGTTAADGAFAFDELVPGPATVAVNAEGFRPRAFPVEIGNTGVTRLDLELSPGARVTGVVRSVRGPLADARVTLVDAAGNVVGSATTGEDGAYAFTDLDAGEYTVMASGYPPVADALSVTGQGAGEHEITLAHPED